MARYLGQFECAGAVDHDIFIIVDVYAGQRSNRRAGGDQNIFRGVALVAHLDFMRAFKRAAPLDPVDLVLLEQERDAAGQFRDRLQFFGQHLLQIELDAGQFDAEFFQRSRMGFVIEFRRVEHRLGRDTSDVETGAAKSLAAFHAGRFQAQLRRPDCRDIAARAGADYQKIIVEIVGHILSLTPSWRTCVSKTDIGLPAYKSIKSRAGSSIASFIRTRKVTASRPSIRRWS